MHTEREDRNLKGKIHRCPICGSGDISGFVVSTTEWTQDDRSGKAYVECRHCYAMTRYWNSISQAATAWENEIVHIPDKKELYSHFALCGDRVIQKIRKRKFI